MSACGCRFEQSECGCGCGLTHQRVCAGLQQHLHVLGSLVESGPVERRHALEVDWVDVLWGGVAENEVGGLGVLVRCRLQECSYHKGEREDQREKCLCPQTDA